MQKSADTSEAILGTPIDRSYVGVHQRLGELVRQGRWRDGEALPSEAVLCGELRTTRKTLRRALVSMEREGLIASRVAASGKRTGRVVLPAKGRSWMSRTVGLLFELAPAILDAFHRELVQRHRGELVINMAIGDALRTCGFHYLVLNPYQLRDGDVRGFLAHAPGAVICDEHTCRLPEIRRILDHCAQQGIPGAMTGEEENGLPFDRVSCDHEAGAYALTQFLIGRGCRRMIEAGNAPACHWTDARTRGHRAAMRAASLAPLPRLEIAAPGAIAGTEEEFAMRVRQYAGFLVEHVQGASPVDAILAQNDFDAVRIAAALRLLGKVPNVDVLITGFDDLGRVPENAWEPEGPIATMDKRPEELGSTLVEVLVKRLNGQTVQTQTIQRIAPRLVVRER